MLPHRAYKNQFPLYDEIFILLNHMKELYSNRGINITPLKLASDKYAEWLLAEKTIFNRKRKLSQAFLEEKLIKLINTNQLMDIIKNEKLCVFIKKILVERRTFNYNTLKLA